MCAPPRNARAYGVSEAAPGEEPKRLVAVLGGKRDPGYWETARMLLESALCLALQVCARALRRPSADCLANPQRPGVARQGPASCWCWAFLWG